MKAEILFLISFAASSYAHSWASCINWKPNNPNNPGFKDNEGTCEGYVRRYPLGYKLGNGQPMTFGRDDNAYGAGWVQGNNNEDFTNKGACTADNFAPRDQTRPASIDQAYGPNKYNEYTYGKMAQIKAGEKLCMRWPAKNHYDNMGDSEVDVWAVPAAKDRNGITQGEVSKEGKKLGTLAYRNCPAIQEVRNYDQGDSNGPGSDLRPCGGCVTVPADFSGDYMVQWRWRHNKVVYASCGDVKVAATAAAPSPSPAAPAPAPAPAPGPAPAPAPGPAPAPAPAPAPENSPKPKKGKKPSDGSDSDSDSGSGSSEAARSSASGVTFSSASLLVTVALSAATMFF